MWIRGTIAALCLPGAAFGEKPLSAIDWLGKNGPAVLAVTLPPEPPVTSSALNPEIVTSPLGSLSTPVGLVPANVTGLSPDIWRASDSDEVARLIRTVQVRNSPALQTLLYTLLLTEANDPVGAQAGETLLLARLDRLIDLGAVEAARELAEHAGATRSAARFSRWFDTSLLTGDEDRGCAVLMASPHLTEDYATRIFCQARSGNWGTAALTMEAAVALDLIPGARRDLLDRFLSPDVFEDAPPLPQPAHPDPLTFRLFETIGEPLPTGALPRAYANADLRDLAGWKAQIEAAERLARVGALSPNSLLGLYTARRPAASGGLWDRVEAVQRLDTALASGSAEAVSKTLPAAWAEIRAAELELPFAALFADQLGAIAHVNPSIAALVWRIRLLSPGYEAAAAAPPGTSTEDRFLAALALGQAGTTAAHSATAEAIRAGWADPADLPDDLMRALAKGELGLVILKTMALFRTGAEGNPDALGQALAMLRHVGLEDTARRAALQVILLERQ